MVRDEKGWQILRRTVWQDALMQPLISITPTNFCNLQKFAPTSRQDLGNSGTSTSFTCFGSLQLPGIRHRSQFVLAFPLSGHSWFEAALILTGTEALMENLGLVPSNPRRNTFMTDQISKSVDTHFLHGRLFNVDVFRE